MERRKKVFLSLLLLVCASLLLMLPASAAGSKKKYRIKVSDIKVNSANLKPGDRCKISMKIVNKGYEKLDIVGLVYSSSTTQSRELYLKYNKSSRRWIGDFKVEQGMQKGLWRIQYIFFNGDPYEDGLILRNSYFTNVEYDIDEYHIKNSDLSKGNICIRGTKADYSKPEIHLDTLSVSKSSVSSEGGNITYRLKVTDKSKVGSVRLTISEPILEDTLLMDTEITMKYNKKTGYYEATIWKPKGTYLLDHIYARDIFGNSVTYFNKECEKYNPDREAYYNRIDLSKFRVDLSGTFSEMPVSEESGDLNPDIQVTKIKYDKKVLKGGKKLTVQLNFKSDIEMNKVKIAYRRSGFSTCTAKLKAVNEKKTKWKGTLLIKKNMKKGVWGLSGIEIEGKNKEGKEIKCRIRNNRWAVEDFGISNTIDQNLSEGNIKIMK